jgi:hypothetical protein
MGEKWKNGKKKKEEMKKKKNIRKLYVYTYAADVEKRSRHAFLVNT